MYQVIYAAYVHSSSDALSSLCVVLCLYSVLSLARLKLEGICFHGVPYGVVNGFGSIEVWLIRLFSPGVANTTQWDCTCSPSIAKQCRETKLGRESLQLHTKPQFPERRDRDTARTAGL